MKVAIIGGTGIGTSLSKEGGKEIVQSTTYGPLHALEKHDGTLLVSRHGSGHKLPPHRVPYRAIAAGLSDLAVKVCVSSAAVGSLHAALRPGQLVAVRDFIDLTGRNVTMFEDSVRHTDFTPGVSPRIVKLLVDAGTDAEGVYACTNGPRYETPAEVRMLRTLGADVVGMTMATEAVVMREVGIEYGCLAIVANFAAGTLDKPLDHGEVEATVAGAYERAIGILLKVAGVA